ncbi:MAG: alkaline phosphatase family protein [Anaerolineae bacterium]|nr:alkaline phosphatase family protein [Anaerolineae bacterium]
MIWLHLRIVDFFNALAARYYRRKFGAAARQLGRTPHPDGAGQRGFVAIEIDGLGYRYLRQAIRTGAMPYLARLITTRRLRLARWRCGLPSTTPASQAGILYGNNWDIPGFRWYDKRSGESIMCKLPGVVRAIQERVSEGRPGLLRGGSSYTNMFDGDARLALFTLSAMGRDRFFENVRGFGFLVLFLLSPGRVLRVVGLSLWTWLVYVGKRAATWLRARQKGSHFTFLGPLLEIANNVVFREVTTFSVMMDIYRQMPAIYASYTGYDEIAHHFGAGSPEARRALRALDNQIRHIDRIRQTYQAREYDLYILSDHGMTPSVPFRAAFGLSLEQFVAERTGQQVYAGEGEDEGLPEQRARFLVEEIRGLEAQRRGQIPTLLLQATRRRLEEELLAQALEAEWDLSRRGEIAVRNSGSLSHIYFQVTPRQMDLGEIALLYPQLLPDLVGHPGIGLVAGRDGEHVVVTSEKGTLWVGPEGERLEGEDPLAGYEGRGWAVGQVVRLMRFPHAGDLVLLGTWDGEQVICFEEQVSSHGGLGGPQTQPFLAYSADVPLCAGDIENAEEVYEQLQAIYRTVRDEVEEEN